jgi:hypothetical protein
MGHLSGTYVRVGFGQVDERDIPVSLVRHGRWVKAAAAVGVEADTIHQTFGPQCRPDGWERKGSPGSAGWPVPAHQTDDHPAPSRTAVQTGQWQADHGNGLEPFGASSKRFGQLADSGEGKDVHKKSWHRGRYNDGHDVS